MPEFRFHIPIEPRYADLDPQWHVNNVRYLAYLEHARLTYLVQLGLWDGVDFNRLGLIVADIHIAYLAPMLLWQKVRLEMRTAKIGNKSLTFEYRLLDESTGQLLATAESVMVAFDYNTQKSIPVPPEWRAKICAFEAADF
jgi:acyl-CoA thioester hydrolase